MLVLNTPMMDVSDIVTSDGRQDAEGHQRDGSRDRDARDDRAA